jgi:hypothetical protein
MMLEEDLPDVDKRLIHDMPKNRRRQSHFSRASLKMQKPIASRPFKKRLKLLISAG